jgi:hypothetical protein
VQRTEKWISLAAFGFAIELVLFKFVPDLGTAMLQHRISTLTDFATFERIYLAPGSVHHARFLGNYILYDLARLLGSAYHSADLRLHPLRVAAGILTPLYAYLGVHFAVWERNRLAWRYFAFLYAFMVLVGMYVFYPADMPALAFLSMALYFLLTQRFWPALLLMLVLGLFRETSFHIVWLVAVWAWCERGRSLRERLIWLGVFAAVFAAEYLAIRQLFPGPISSRGGVDLDPRLLLDSGSTSLTILGSVGLAVLFPLACLLYVRSLPPEDWRRAFFRINAYVFPAWLVFYRLLNGNLSELRMLWPVLLPCIYGIAYAAARNKETGAGGSQQQGELQSGT